MLPAPLPASINLPAGQLGRFYSSVGSLLELWVQRRASRNTQRAYREDVLTFVRFLGLNWPEQSQQLLTATVPDVHAYRDWLIAAGAAPKTLNRRISSLSGFYRYLASMATEMRLPVVLPNPAHAQFIARASSDPRTETRALSAAEARRLIHLPSGTGVREARDRAILKLYLYTGMRLSTGCRLLVEDFAWGEEASATLRVREKGERIRVIGIHNAAAQALQEYTDQAGLTSGPLFRPLSGAGSQTLLNRPIAAVTMYMLLKSYLERLPGAVRLTPRLDGSSRKQCLYTPHSLRATTATLLLESGVDITKVQELMGHKHITTTQIYDKRRRLTSQSASHEVPL
jgi:site-specific recombinase XerD